MNETAMTNTTLKCPWRIKGLAIFLIVVFGFATIAGVIAFYLQHDGLPISAPEAVLATATNLAFVIGGAALLRLRPWGLWLTVGLCGLSIVTLLWHVFTELTPKTATKSNEIGTYVVAGFYLAIAFLLTSESSRKAFKPTTPV
jgi:CBS domain containing-hemolysin-like protein